ncbi:hypothetical protein [Dipodfec virus UOA04_Rod_660]|nr:hypothetical protein [Dipodfec virus UOA04_Rod_660]
MALDWLYIDTPQFVSRGTRILSVLDGSGSIDLIPGRPDVSATPSDFDKGDRFDPDIEFDPNSYSRMDKFDGLEMGQHFIDSSLDNASSSAKSTSPEEKK